MSLLCGANTLIEVLKERDASQRKTWQVQVSERKMLNSYGRERILGVNVNMSGSEGFRLASTRVTLKCPECRASNEVTLDQVKQGEAIDCAECNRAISLIDKDKNVDQAVGGLLKSIDDLKRSLENSGPST